MILLDTNLIIYAAQGVFPALYDYVADNTPAVSAISYVEALGYHRITPFEKRYLEVFFDSAEVLGMTDDVLSEAVALRQACKMSLGDALIAGTALVHGCQLATRNVKDFQWISALSIVDPLAV